MQLSNNTVLITAVHCISTLHGSLRHTALRSSKIINLDRSLHICHLKSKYINALKKINIKDKYYNE